MLNAVYRLTAPGRFEVEFNEIDLLDDIVLVRPTHLSICNADQRYYQGSRPADILAKKLPMALIHEGIGQVVADKSGEFAPGQMVVMIPNTPVEEDDVIAENYLRSSMFRSSGYDGFMQDNVAMRRDRLIPLPADIDLDVAAFTEFVSVCCHSVYRFRQTAHSRRGRIGIWGDGSLAFIVTLILRYLEPESELLVFGKHGEKLENFTFADQIVYVNDVPEYIRVDHAFECVGGPGAPAAINQIIDCIEPEGTIAILGVTEDPAPIKTRMILEKGLRLIGNSRSGRPDFINTIEMYNEHPEMIDYLKCLVSRVVEVNEIDDVVSAFEADINKSWGKTILHWNK